MFEVVKYKSYLLCLYSDGVWSVDLPVRFTAHACVHEYVSCMYAPCNVGVCTFSVCKLSLCSVCV